MNTAAVSCQTYCIVKTINLYFKNNQTKTEKLDWLDYSRLRMVKGA